MYQVVIIEDDDDQANAIIRLLDHHARRTELALTRLASGEELDAYMAHGGGASPDVLLMDIVLGDRAANGQGPGVEGAPTARAASPLAPANGIDLVRRHFPEGCGTQVIYITGFIEYCTKVYQTEHVYFLTKPVDQGDFNAALDKALVKCAHRPARLLEVQVGSAIKALPLDKISYIESDRRKVRIHTNGEVVETYASLSSLCERLPVSFIRCHKGFVVNMDCIGELQATDILLLSGELVPLSQRKRAGVREAFLAHLHARA